MALLSRDGDLAVKFKKAISTVGGLAIAATSRMAAGSMVTITVGAGAPSASEPNGSIYLRTNASTADEAIYARIGGAWVVIDGAP